MVYLVIFFRLRVADLERKIGTDHLTQVMNRYAFEQEFELLLKMLPSHGVQIEHRSLRPMLVSLSVLFIDIDKFKIINDKFGHKVGDLVLQHVAGAISHNLREVDLVARLGGEEIVVALPGLSSNEAIVVAEKLRRLVSNLKIENLDYKVTVSIGVVSATERVSREEIIERADMAMYKAKQSGRNRVCVAD